MGTFQIGDLLFDDHWCLAILGTRDSQSRIGRNSKMQLRNFEKRPEQAFQAHPAFVLRKCKSL